MAWFGVRPDIGWLRGLRHDVKLIPVATTGSRTFLCHGQTQMRELGASQLEICPVKPVSTLRPSATTMMEKPRSRERLMKARRCRCASTSDMPKVAASACSYQTQPWLREGPDREKTELPCLLGTSQTRRRQICNSNGLACRI